MTRYGEIEELGGKALRGSGGDLNKLKWARCVVVIVTDKMRNKNTNLTR